MQKLKLLMATMATTMFGTVMMPVLAHAASNVSVNFELPTYVLGNINGQDGWSKIGPFDSAVSLNNTGFTSFGSQSLRLSDAVTSRSFGDQTFTKPLADAVGEVDSTDGTFSRGSLQRHFEMKFDIASTQTGVQTGMHTSVSPDRGDGSRMSYLRFDDDINGIDVSFSEVTGITSSVNFTNDLIANDLSRTAPHTVKLTLDTLDGPSNDVVKVWVDGTLVKTGTSWENYYRYDNESSAEQYPRIVKTVIFRESGTANEAHRGMGFLFDNLTLSSGAIPPALVGPATNKDQCKNDGWKIFNNPTYKNQGDCVSAVVSNGKANGNPAVANKLTY